MKSLNLTVLLLLAVCAGVPSNGGTEMYGETIAGVETGRTTPGC